MPIDVEHTQAETEVSVRRDVPGNAQPGALRPASAKTGNHRGMWPWSHHVFSGRRTSHSHPIRAQDRVTFSPSCSLSMPLLKGLLLSYLELMSLEPHNPFPSEDRLSNRLDGMSRMRLSHEMQNLTGQMAQSVKELAANADYLSSIPETHMMRDKN